jgi:hypothetical protein
LSLLAGLNEALQRCLIELAYIYGGDAKSKLRAIRDELIFKFQNGVVSDDNRAMHARRTAAQS